MRLDGEWALFDDGVVRPMIRGEIRADNGAWVKAPFLVDTGLIAPYSVQQCWRNLACSPL